VGGQYYNGSLIEWEGVAWIDLAQDRDQWRALVNTLLSMWLRINIINAR
jgi:hypothetical protein